jgi:hypothetical protein
MRQLLVWIALVCVLSGIVFSGAVVTFEHFWHAWEFLAAATAALYNLFFAIVVYASRREPHEGTLHDALSDGGAVATHLLLRVSLPSLLFFGTMVVVLWDRQAGASPVPARSVLLKLFLTLGAFVCIWTGDFVTARYLSDPKSSDHRLPFGWIVYFRTRLWLIDLPFVVGYAGLICVYSMYRYGPVASTSMEHQLLVQAFIGGASALELMIQSAIHGFSEIGE